MRFWIQCTAFETGRPIHINIALVGSMSRDGERTGELTSRLASDTATIQSAVSANLSMGMRNAVQLVGALGLLAALLELD